MYLGGLVAVVSASAVDERFRLLTAVVGLREFTQLKRWVLVTGEEENRSAEHKEVRASVERK